MNVQLEVHLAQFVEIFNAEFFNEDIAGGMDSY